MTTLLRTLEAWTVHQDYFWFLGMLAWLAVAFGAWRRDEGSGQRQPWLALLAAMYALICAVEILMFSTAANFTPPYTEWDFCLGLALCAAIAAMAQPSLDRLPPAPRMGATLLLSLGLIALAVWRMQSPVPAGWLLALSGASAAWLLVRAYQRGRLLPDAVGGERKLFSGALALLALIPVLIDFGALSYWAGEGRRSTDLSRFSLLSALLCLTAGILSAATMWRRFMRSSAWSDHTHRELRAPLAVLGLWLGIGFVLTVGSGWLARRGYEKTLVLRAQTAAALFDPAALEQVLSPKVKRGPMLKQTVTSTNAVVITTRLQGVISGPAFTTIRAQLRQMRILNPDFGHAFLATLRGGRLISVAMHSDRPNSPQLVFRSGTGEDCRDLVEKRVALEGPSRTPFGSVLTLRVPVQPASQTRATGWLMVDVSAANWTTTFASARFQTMLIVGIGVGLWATAIAYRLRRVERERAERAAREAAAADRAKSEFLAHVSHELRTPIQSMLGYAELLAASPLGEIERRRLDALRGQSGLLLRLVNDLIDLGALQAGVFRLQPTTVDAAALTRECLETIRPQAEARHLTLRSEIEPGSGWIEADGQRLRQVLLNLLTNAVKFTNAGTITLCMQRLTEPAAMIEWTVQDTGPGIAPEDQEKIFQPFVRLDHDHAVAGAGMGLALCARLCAAMKGSIAVQSEGESGTTFVVRLPRHERAPAISGPATSGSTGQSGAVTAWHGLQVLVADDNTLVRELLVAFFEERGASTTAVADGLAVVEACAERAFHVVVLDLSMPWLDGRETARRLRRPGATPAAPWIIGLSAHASREEADAALAAGMDRFLTKPVSFAELSAAVAEAPGARARPSSVAASPAARPALAQRLAQQFFAETPAIVADMRMALANRDWSRLRSRAHYLKNSADVLGAEELRCACNALYLNADSAEADRLHELVAAIEVASCASSLGAQLSPDYPAQP